jgi:hypothetical protein
MARAAAIVVGRGRGAPTSQKSARSSTARPGNVAIAAGSRRLAPGALLADADGMLHLASPRRSAPLAAVGLIATLATFACGGGDAPAADAGGDADAGLCAGRPCRTLIADAADWAAVSAPHTRDGRCDFLEDGKFIAPATAGAALQEVVFQDVKVHRLHLGFMTQALPEFFGGLTPQQYQQVVLRRADRQYWAGALFRLVDDGGDTIGYGFDVAVDPAWDEQLTEAEVAAVAALLAPRFRLPLVYAPVSDTAIYFAQQFTSIEPHLPRQCQFVRCPTAGTDCVVVPSATTVCGHFWEGRTIEVEHARKARVAVAAGTVALPRELGEHTVPAIFGAGELGPSRVPIAPASVTATYQVSRPAPSVVSRSYRQRYTTPTGPIDLTWELWLPDTGGGFLFEEPHLGDFVNVLLGSGTFEEMSTLSTCTGEAYERWRARATLADGGSIAIEYQYQPPFAGSGPLFPVRAEVTLGGQTAIVDDYFRLVYAGEHHNWNNQFWVLFDAPLTYQGHAVHGVWLDEAAFTSELDGVYTLDAARRPLDTLTATSYVVERAP